MNSSKHLTRPKTVAEFQTMLSYIYTKANKRYTDKDLFLRLMEEISVVMELARKDELEKMPSQLTRTYSWLNGVANRLGVELQEALWHKYPNVCSYCLRCENCLCAIEHPNIPKKEEALRRLRRDRIREPKTLAEHQDLHRKLYFRQNRRILILQTAAHLAEEAGEISREFRHGNKQGIEDEISDAVSWIFAIANRCGFEMSETVWQQYPYECEKCHMISCICDCSDPPEEN